MHNYLRAIGFSNITRNVQILSLVDEMKKDFDDHALVIHEKGYVFAEVYKEFAPDMGIVACGELDENHVFHMEYYSPYFKGDNASTEESLSIERRASNESYLGACDEPKIGISLIFSLQNTAEYLKQINQPEEPEVSSVTLSALSKEGNILLPLQKNPSQKAIEKENCNKRSSLIKAARRGDENAIESLSVEDVDTNNLVNKRAKKEDIYTIVDTCFIPYGMECDQYQVMGEILAIKVVENKITKEQVYQLKIECNHLIIDVCINVYDLLGEPKVGRRFKGVIWLQGYINFS